MTQTTTFENTVTHPLRVFLVEDSLDVRELMIENLTMIPGVVVAGVSESEGDALNQSVSYTHLTLPTTERV